MELEVTKLEFDVDFFSTSFFMKLECLKLDLQSKLEFQELEFQKTGILLLIL